MVIRIIHNMSKKQPKKEKAKKIDLDISHEAINLVKGERDAWKDAVVFVTDRLAFDIRNLLKTVRKNYWGIFDHPKDPVSGKKLTWIPLTEIVCDAHVKNADIDTEDVKITSKKRKAIGLTTLVRNVLHNWLDKDIFGEELDESERQMSIDGSIVWKTFEGVNEDGKTTVIRTYTNLLNIFFDWTSESIQSAYRFTERALLKESEVKDMDGWINTEDIMGVEGLHPTDFDLAQANTSTFGRQGSKFVDVWELWGKIPKSLITGNKKDNEEEVDGHIVVSGLENPGKEQVHLIETNPSGLKPYEEAHTKKIKGRWLARGPAESVMMLQSWVNMIVNIRKLRAQISQLGIFKIKKGAGVTPQMIGKLAANGALIVNSMDDVEQLIMKEASESSYKDEEQAVNWAERVTNALEPATGEPVPASTSATAIVLQSRSIATSFSMFKNAIGYFLRRWIKRHALPILMRNLTPGEIVRITGSPEEIRELDERIVDYFVYKELDKMTKAGFAVNLEEVENERIKALDKLRKLGKDRYIEIINSIDVTDYDVEISITNENIDKSLLANNLIKAMEIAPQFQDILVEKVFDLMGLDTFQLEERTRKVGSSASLPQPAGSSQIPTNPPTEQQITTEANLPV